MHDVITVGSATVDVFADTDSELIKIMTSKTENDFLAYPAGSKIIIKNLIFTSGGGGTNTAVSFARLGMKTAWLGRVGGDENGKKILELLKKEKVKFIGTKGKLDEMSGYSIILDSIEDDRTILTYKGANDNLKFEEIKKSNLKAKWFYFSAMINDSYKALEKLADYAKKNKINLAFNPSSYLAKQGSKYLSNVLKCTTALILNREEANLVLGTINAEASMLLSGLHMMGPKYIIITDGKNGVHAFDGKEAYFIPAHKVNVIESTGAGDAFASAFICGLIKTKDFKYSLKLAMANSESILTHKGAKTGLMTWNAAISKVSKMHFDFHHIKMHHS